MSIGWIKSKKDDRSFKMVKNMGLNVYELEELEDTDIAIKEMVQQHCDTIIVSSEIAGFSEDIIKKYSKNEEISIIIAPTKKEY